MRNEHNNEHNSERNIWLDGMMGLVTGDALGNPVQFFNREKIRERGPVRGIEAGGVYETPIGTWTDDSSMALATLDSIREIGEIVPEDIMLNFAKWLRHGEYTPFGRAFDEGITDVRWLKEQGCMIQINVYSLAGESSRNIRDLARQMVREKLVDFLGTDAHRMNHRPPKIAGGMKELMKIADLDYGRKIASQNAKELLMV